MRDEPVKKNLKRNIVVLLITVVIAILGGSIYIGYKQKQQKQLDKEHTLIKHGFRLLEERQANYIKENYSGVKSIEFSPIFEDGDGLNRQYTLTTVLVIVDTNENRAKLGGEIDNCNYGSFNYPTYFESLQFGISGEENIQFEGSDIQYSNGDKLSEKSKITESPGMDDNISSLVHHGRLDVTKSKEGSPNAEIIYNTTIQKGDYKNWDYKKK